MIACSFLSPLHVPLCLSIRSLQKGSPSMSGSLFNSSFMGCLLSACSILCHGSGALGCWGRGLSSLLMVWDPRGFACHPFMEAYPALDTLHLCSYNMHVCVHAC